MRPRIRPARLISGRDPLGLEAALGGHHPQLDLGPGEVELDRDEALSRARLQALEDVLVARVVGDDEHELVGGHEQLARALKRQGAAVVGERVEDDRDVLPRLDHLVEVADPALADRSGERPVEPDRLAALEQIAAGEVGGGEVVVAGDGVQPAPEPGRHVGDEAGLAAAGRPLEQERQPLADRPPRTARTPAPAAGRRGSGRGRPKAGHAAHAYSAGARPAPVRTSRAVSCSRTGPNTA